MAIMHKIHNLDDFFEELDEVILLKDFNINIAEDVETVNSLLYTKQTENEVLNTVSCNCGKEVNSTNIGKVCSECGTRVKPISNDYSPILWADSPVEGLKFLNPKIWLMIVDLFQIR